MRGFYWTANSPFIRGMWVRCRRAPRAPALGSVEDGFIDLQVGGRTHRNANPAFMVYEILTNLEWGMGGAASDIDAASFVSAAQLWRNENFGLFMLWTQSDKIEDFLQEVLDHVQAFLFLSPQTGKWTLRPLRNDYDPAALPLYTDDNARFESFERKQPGEIVNEIVVTWTNPLTEKPETVTQQDLASIVAQNGQVVSQGRNYYGVRSAELANVLAARDLRSACAPLARGTMLAFRSAWATEPGQCVRVSIADEDVNNLVMRVMDVDYGDRSNGYVTVTLLEDIFAYESVPYSQAADSAWVSTAQPPNPPAYVKLFTLPAFLVANSADEYTTFPQDPEVNAGLLVSDPNPDFLNYEPYTAATLANGTTVQQSIGTRDKVPYWVSDAALVAEATTTRPPVPGAGLADLLFIGSGDDAATEVALVQAVAADGTFTLARGVLDTVPRAWPIGTPVWVLRQQRVLDPEPRAPGETVSYRPLMRTSINLLAYDQGVSSSFTLSDRPYLPLRPANVKVNGTGFGTVALNGGSANVTWSNRNRLTETSQILGWGAGTVSPEPGQTTTVDVLNGSTLVRSFSGLTGASTTLSPADLSGGDRLRVLAVTAEGSSLQAHVIQYTA